MWVREIKQSTIAIETMVVKFSDTNLGMEVSNGWFQ